MGIKPSQTVTIVDDLDGKEFQTETPDDFKVNFGWGGRRWEVYLSEASRTKVEKFLQPMLDNATDVTPATAPRSGGGGRAASRSGKTAFSKLTGDEKSEFRAWAVKNTDLSEGARRIKDEYVEQWRTAS